MTAVSNPATLSSVASAYGDALPFNLSSATALAGHALPISLASLAGKSLYTPMSPTLSTNDISAGGVGALTTGAVTCAPNGGTGPYSYAWSLVTGTGATCNSPSAATTTFSGVGTFEDGHQSDTTSYWICTVTDVTGASVASPQLEVVFLG